MVVAHQYKCFTPLSYTLQGDEMGTLMLDVFYHNFLKREAKSIDSAITKLSGVGRTHISPVFSVETACRNGKEILLTFWMTLIVTCKPPSGPPQWLRICQQCGSHRRCRFDP